MADIWEILWLCNDYSLTTPPYNSAIIQAFQQTIRHAIQRLIYEYYALCFVLLLSYFGVWFWISTLPSHVILPPDPLQNPAYFLSYLHNIQVFIQTYSWNISIVIPHTRHNLLWYLITRCYQMVDWLHTTCSVLILDLFQTFSNKETQRNDPTLFCTYSNKESTKQRSHLFRTYSNKENTKQQQLFHTYSNKETQSNDPTYSTPFPTKKPQSSNLDLFPP